MESHAEIKKRIIGSYTGWVVRVYCYVRFLIMNVRIMEEIEQYLHKNGRVLEVGCGFGLFSLNFASCEEGRTIQSSISTGTGFSWHANPPCGSGWRIASSARTAISSTTNSKTRSTRW